MAFDMHIADARACVDHHEEFFFTLVEQDEVRYPQLAAIWARFYDDPIISPSQADVVVHKLIDLLTANGGVSNKPLASVVLRIRPFFSKAYKTRSQVRCVSD